MTPEEIAVSALAKLTSNSKSGSPKKSAPAKNEGSRRAKKAVKYPVEPTVIQTISKGRGYMNHSYKDFSKVPPTSDYELPTTIEDMSFSEKVHHILSQEEYEKYISWMPHGRAFKVTVPVVFERSICQKYFGHKRYSSFLRQLNNHGFKHISKGDDRNCYYHECMLKNMPHLCKYMPEPKDARRQIPDPDSEPDLYRISSAYPLPEKVGEVGKSAPAAVPQPSVPDVAAVPVPPVVQQPLGGRLASEVSWMQMPPAKRTALPPPVPASLPPPVAALSAALPQNLALTQMNVQEALIAQQQQQRLLNSLAAEQQIETALQERMLLAALQERQRAQLLRQSSSLSPSSIGEFLRRKNYG